MCLLTVAPLVLAVASVSNNGKDAAGNLMHGTEPLRLVIDRPGHAGRVRGPDVEVRWQIVPDRKVEAQNLSIDGKVALTPGAEDRSATLKGISDGVHTVGISARADGGMVESSSTFYVYRLVQQSAGKLYTLDLTGLRQVNADDPGACSRAFETLHLAAVLQGLVNRERARLYVLFTPVDQFWLDKMREGGAFLEHATLTPLASVDEALTVFRDHIKGAVVWDPQVPCTSNIASTVCGVEGLVPIRSDETPGSAHDRLVRNGPRLKVVHSLVGKFTGKGRIPDTDRESTGSAKCDAYIWAKVRYLDSGKCNPLVMGYWCDAFWLQHPKEMGIDNVGLTNHDFVVARKGFIWDLNVWPDESPRDDPGQRPGLDRETLQEILLSAYKTGKGKMIHIAGFTPWAVKYTTHGSAGGKHEGVPTEWETSRLASAYNAYVDADAIGLVGMANASVFSLANLPDRLVQNPPPTYEELQQKGYILPDGKVALFNFVYHYLGDYDSAAWIYNRMPEIWRNPVRGQIPSGWALNPNLIERMPVAFDWFYETKSPLDYFVAGDSGAGYVNPTQLLPPREPSGLPSGADAWIEHNIRYFRQLNYSVTGFIINGFCGETTGKSNRMFLPFSGDGIMTQLHWMPKNQKEDHLLEGVPIAGMKQDISAPVDVVVEAILKHVRPNETRFLSFRSILVGPDWIKTVNDRIRAARPDCRFEPVDPYTYFYLLRHHLGGKNEKRATYTFDTMPDSVKAGQAIKVTAGLRNDGWDAWESTGPDAVRLHAGFDGRAGGVFAALAEDTRPGEGSVVSFTLKAPARPGKYVFHLELVRGKDGWFGDAYNMAWEKEITVVRAR